MSIPNNSILDFVRSIEIKHKDIPHIIIQLTIIFGACLAGWIFWGLTGLITAAILFGFFVIISLLYHLFRANQTSLVYQQQKIQDYLTLFNEIDFRAPLPYLTGFAATPELARVVYAAVVNHKPLLTVELGSGVSSVIIGYGLEKNGQGSLISLDHDETYLRRTREMLEGHSLSRFGKVEHCPIKKQSVNSSNHRWYDISALTFSHPIDLLVIDGPPEQTQHKARYPAMPLLYEYLNDSAIIILDDVKRAESTKTVHDWLNKYDDLSFELMDTEKGIGIFKRQLID